MIYSRTCEYAVRALSYLAGKKTSSYTMTSEISKETGVPGPYIAKILQSLVRSGILQSMTGPRGGVAFKRDPNGVHLKDVVEAVDDLEELELCVMGLDRCSSKNACPLHDIWVDAKQKLLQKMAHCRLTEVTKQFGKLPFRKSRRSRPAMRLQLSVG